MPGLSAALPVLFAQAQNAPAGGAGGNLGLGSYMFLIQVGVVVALFYMIMLRPQQRQEKKRKEMLAQLKKNDRVLTSAGIYGTVVSIEDGQERVVLRVDDDRGTRIAFTRASVVMVLDAQDRSKEKEKEKAETA
jgi:preprotein translocase subunit YajC